MGYIMNKSVLPVTLCYYKWQVKQNVYCRLYIESCDADMECVKRLLIKVKSLKKLTLKIHCNNIIQILADGLKNCTDRYIRNLIDISGSCIQDVKTLATGLRFCRKLEIHDNGLSSDEIGYIFMELGSYKLKLNYQDIIVGKEKNLYTFSSSAV